jgi:hypothetical protein
MRKVRMLLVAGVAAAALVAPAAPAQASCQTDIGDVCKLVDVLCTTPAGQKYLGYCN